MKIGIDIQALQTRNSRDRGIGRYTKSVIEALIDKQTIHTYKLFANNMLPAPDLDKNQFSYYNINYPYIGSCYLNDLLMKTTLTSADIESVLIPSPMEDLEATISNYQNYHKKVFVICYDLIPLIFADRYLNDPNMYSLYMKRLENVKNADFVFAISESTRQDVIKYLDRPADRVINISGGVSSFFCPISMSDRQSWLQKFAEKFAISKNFVLYTGGEDWRKNIEGLLKAFAKLPKNIQECYQLVIACKVTAFFVQELASLASKLGIERSLILTNYVTDEELRALYSTCSLFVFPSFYEGFGLPLLEAISCGAPAIASNSSSLPEILGSNEQLFDAHSVEDIARLMNKVLSDENFHQSLSEKALKQANTFTWKSVAQKISDVFQEQEPIEKATILFNRIKNNNKPHIAFFSPLPPLKSGISNYAEDLIPSLDRYFNLDLIHDNNYLPNINLANKLLPYSQFETYLKTNECEGIFYQIGNSSYHCYMYSHLMRYSGITVLHDYYLGGLINYMDNFCPELRITLAKELEYCYGLEKAKDILGKLQKGLLNVHEKFPEAGIYLNRRIFTRSLGVILHNRWAYQRAIKDFGNDNEHIVHIPLLVPSIAQQENQFKDIRLECGIAVDSFIISTFGFISSTKRPLSILLAFKRYLYNNPSAYLIFVGGTDYLGSIDIEAEIKKLDLQNRIKVTNFVTMSEFYRYIKISDICLNLRFPSNGESSASLLKILSIGKPAIVTDIDSFSDFSDDVVFKIPPPTESNEVEEIYKALITLTENSEHRNFLSQNALKYVEKEHSPERCARLYAEFFEQVQRCPQTKVKMLADYVGRETVKIEIADPQQILVLFSKVINNLRDASPQENDLSDLRSIQPAALTKTIISFNDFLHECRSICLKKLPSANKILSIGCSGIWYFEWFHKFYPYSVEEHTGIDLNSQPENLPANIVWIQNDGSDLTSLESESFDLVFAGQFIEHISWESQTVFLSEVNRVLKPNGLFVLDSPNYEISNRYGWRQPEHIHELTFSQICKLLKLSSFDIQETYGLVPKNLFGKPPQLVGKYLENAFQDKFYQEGIKNAINEEPNDSFIWWITARKNNNIIDKKILTDESQKIYNENQKSKYYVIYHQIGKIIEYNDAYYVNVNSSDAPGYALFGSYDFYPKGNYVVEYNLSLFDFNKKNTISHFNVAIVDVVTDAGEKILVKREIKSSELLNNSTIKLQFSLNELSSLEFRVFYLGKLSLIIGVQPKISSI
jgi:glycosyltransferase involved in cell wall biosynthesis/ubiquinone/menaquinone biosynthesis C-methylase UbiE